MSATVVQATEEGSVTPDVRTLEDLLIKMAWGEYKRFWRELSNHDLTPSQFQVLAAIKENPVGCSMSFLAAETRQVSATMTGIVDRLVEHGLVERRRNPSDRRRVLVYLTEQGRAKLEAVYQARCLRLSSYLENMDESARHSLALSLKQYLQMLEQTLS